MRTERTNYLTTGMTGLLLGLSVVKAGNVVASKIVLNDIDPWSAVFYRSVLAALFVVLLGAVSRRAPVAPWRLGWLGLLSTTLFAANVMLFYVGTSLTAAGRVAIIINLQPLVVAFIAPLLFPEEALTGRKLLGLLCALVGATVIISGDMLAGGGIRLGDALTFAAMLLWATGTVLEKRVLGRLPAERAAISVVTWNMTFLAVALTAGMLLTGRRPAQELGVEGTYAMAFLITVGSGMFIATRWLMQRAPVSLITSFNFLLPVWGVLMSVVLLDETLTGDLVAGMLLVALGIAIANRPPRMPTPISTPLPTAAVAEEGARA